MNKTTSGFTIVELLIVIVVIAILAAISVVAYNGIQNRANDTAVQNDITSLAKQVRLLEANTGSLPPGGATRTAGVDSGNTGAFPNIMFAPAKASYDSTVNNLYYCTGIVTATGTSSFRIYARSKSATTFRYSPESGLQNLGNTTFSSHTCLTDFNDGSSWNYGYNTSSWFTLWIK